MQDLEQLKSLAKELTSELPREIVIDLIDRLQAAEKDLLVANEQRRKWRDTFDAMHRRAMKSEAELKALREQKPFVQILTPDSDDVKNEGVSFSLQDWGKLDHAPAGTKLYARPLIELVQLKQWFENRCRLNGAQDCDLEIVGGKYTFEPIQKQWESAVAGAQYSVLPLQSRDSAEPNKEFPTEPTLEMCKVLKCWIKSGDEFKFYQALVNSLPKSNANNHSEQPLDMVEAKQAVPEPTEQQILRVAQMVMPAAFLAEDNHRICSFAYALLSAAQQPSNPAAMETLMEISQEYGMGYESQPEGAAPEQDLFWREKLAVEYCKQHCIEPETKEYAIAVTAFVVGIGMQQSPAPKAQSLDRVIELENELIELINHCSVIEEPGSVIDSAYKTLVKDKLTLRNPEPGSFNAIAEGGK